MEAEDSTMEEQVGQSTQAKTCQDVVDEEAAPTTSGVDDGTEEVPQPSDLDVQGNEAETQDEAVASSEVESGGQGPETTDEGECGL